MSTKIESVTAQERFQTVADILVHRYDMMRKCWQTDPKDRPSFSALSQWLEDMTSTISASELPDIRFNLSQDLYNVSIRWAVNSSWLT